ncbi:MAG: Gfo/Idh/MocA family oxidoreductase [Pirellulaceae bacterium]|jgi:predicted dehydrogenase|nr:Gfo/Idh/MocA family oxidoreductase [Pirellulaceae bacterium]MDP6720782.1 Gfo/Idh/MocA family oxidoreductase [Pirellulaceae bacterium]
MTFSRKLGRKLRMALIGGGGSGFIGRVHATAATLDNRAELVAGVLSSDPVKARAVAPDFGIPIDRAYGSLQELLDGETRCPADDRIDFVSIATPNNTHFPIAKAALEAGFDVVCDKPMTTSLADAESLAAIVKQTGAVFVLTHNYTGYPMIRQAREMIQQGELGELYAFRANYIQGWLQGLEPGKVPARGAWKSDPEKTGPAGALGDVGTHAFQLARYTTGLRPIEVSSTLQTFVLPPPLDDYGHALVKFSGGVLGMITISQVTHGRLNDLTLEIDGSKGSLVWRQESPNQLIVRRFGQPTQTYERSPSAAYTNESGRAACRLPGGHPEAFFEAFANVYRDGFDAMIARDENQSLDACSTVYPNVNDGVEGVFFIEQCVASSQERGAWKQLANS